MKKMDQENKIKLAHRVTADFRDLLRGGGPAADSEFLAHEAE